MKTREQQPQIEKIRIDTLRVPPVGQAQRPFREAKGDRIAAEFDINNFGFPVVCRVDGTNWVVDGQHRLYAIQKCGYAKASDLLPCEVYEGLSMTEMARMFLGRNRSTPVTPFERFGVAVTAGYPTETAITEIVESTGLKIGHPKVPGQVYSVGALRRVYDRHGPAVLERVMRVLCDAYQGAPAGLGRTLIDGVGLVVATYGGLNRQVACRSPRQRPSRGACAEAAGRGVPGTPWAPGPGMCRRRGGRHLQPACRQKALPREVVEDASKWASAPGPLVLSAVTGAAVGGAPAMPEARMRSRRLFRRRARNNFSA